MAIINGTNGDELINGTSENDTIDGKEGNDTIYGNKENDVINGGDGNDILIDFSYNTIYYYYSNIYSYNGFYNSFYRSYYSDDTFTETKLSYNSNINGGSGNDLLIVGGNGNIFNGDEGNDSISANGSNNTVYGGDGSDIIYIYDQNNLVYGGEGDDDISVGGNGDDWSSGNSGHNTIDGGAGDDYIYTRDSESNNTVYGGEGNDSITLVGDGSTNTVYGGEGDDYILLGGDGSTIDGGEGDDDIEIYGGSSTIEGGAGDDDINVYENGSTIEGGEGDDIFRFSYGYNNNSRIIKDFNIISEKIVFSDSYDYYQRIKFSDLQISQEGANTVIKISYNSTDTIITLENINKSDITKNHFVNLNPDAIDDVALATESTYVTGNLLTNDISRIDYDPYNPRITSILNNQISKVNGNSASVGVQITLASGALLTVNANGTFDYNPNGQFNALDNGQTGTDTFTYEISDNRGGFDTATVTVTINGEGVVNIIPNALNDTAVTTESATVTGNVLTNDTDSNNDTLTVSKVNDNTANVGSQITLASGALLTVNANGTYDYNPNGKFNTLTPGQSATDSFTYEASDGNGGVSTATVNITINGTANLMEGTALADILIGTPLEDEIYGKEGNDTINAKESNDVVYGQDGQDLIRGGAGDDTVYGGNDHDSLYGNLGNDIIHGDDGSDSLYGNEGSDILYGNLGNDRLEGGAEQDYLYGGDGDDTIEGGQGNDVLYGGEGYDVFAAELNYEATNQDIVKDFDVSQDKIIIRYFWENYQNEQFRFSQLDITQDGANTVIKFPYTIFPQYTGNDTTIILENVNKADITKNHFILLRPENVPPNAKHDSVTTTESNSVGGNVLSNDTDNDNNVLTVVKVNGQSNNIGLSITTVKGGIFTLNANGTYVYNPNGQFNHLNLGQTATDSFNYEISDGDGGSHTATVTITINGENDAPDAVNDTSSVAENEELAGNLLTNDTDSNNDILTISKVNGSATNVGSQITLASGALLTVNPNGTYSYNPNGTYSYNPNGKFNELTIGETATDSFTYEAFDGNGGFDTATVIVTINGNDINDPVTLLANLHQNYHGKANYRIIVWGNPSEKITIQNNNGFSYTGYLNSNGYEAFIVPKTEVMFGTSVNDQGFRVLADNPISAYVSSIDTGTTEISLIYNKESLGTEHILTSYSNQFTGHDGAQFSVQATRNNTILSITFTNGQTLEQTLQKGETFKFSSRDTVHNAELGLSLATSFDITGTYIASNHPVAVFSGHSGTYVGEGAEDHLVEQVPSIDKLSQTYVVGEAYYNGIGNNAVRIIAAEDNTQVSISNNIVATLDKGEFYEFTLGDVAKVITASHKILVAQYLKGYIAAGEADPAMTIVPGIDKWLTSYKVLLPRLALGIHDNNYLNIVIKNSALSSLKLNGNSIDTSNFKFIEGTNLSTGNIRVYDNAPIDITADGTSPFQVSVWGGGNKSGYFSSGGSSYAPGVSNGLPLNNQGFSIVNQAPDAKDKSETIDEIGLLTGNLLVGATDADNEPITISKVNGSATNVGSQITLASGALLTVNPNGTYSYNPNGKFNELTIGETATDSFTYEAFDGNGGFDTATVIVTINGENEVPVANLDTATTLESEIVTDNVLRNDTDSNNDTLTVSKVNGDSASVGTQITLTSGALLTVNANGTYDYNPNGKFNNLNQGQSATDSFTYEASDGNGGVSTATVTVIINGESAVNVAPNAIIDLVSISKSDVLSGNVLTNDTDANGDILTISKVNGLAGNVGETFATAKGGIIKLNADGTYNYNPNGQFDNLISGEIGTDTLTYEASDGNGEVSTGTVMITVNGEGLAVPLPTNNITINDSDIATEIKTGNGDDTINARGGNDVIYAYAGNDTIRGGNGNDYIFASDGIDTIYGDAGNDRIHDGIGNDIISGGDGDDFIYSSLGQDSLRGGNGNDKFIFTDLNHSTVQAKDTIGDFKKGSDKIDLSHLGINNFSEITIQNVASSGSKVSITKTGNPNFVIDVVLSGFTTGMKLATSDFLFASSPEADINLVDVVPVISNINIINGTEINNSLSGLSGKDIIYGYGGDDRISGNAGDDIIFDGIGNDNISGGDGNDQLFSSLGTDTLRGGNQNDSFIYTDFAHSTKTSKDLIIDFQKGFDKVDLSALGIDMFSDLTIKKVLSTGSKVNITTASNADFSMDIAFANFVVGTVLSETDFVFSDVA